MNILLYGGVLLYLFLTTTVAAVVGVEQVATASTLLLVMLSLLKISRFHLSSLDAKYKIEFYILLLALLVILLKIITGNSDAIKNVIFLMIIPVIFSMLLDAKSVKATGKIKEIILIFFITECFLAIYERVYTINIFPYEVVDEYISNERLGFRSTAFLGHPLQNALCVSIIMGFILVSDMRLIRKMSFVLLGYVALLCFNARGAILVWTILMAINIVQVALSKYGKELISFKTISFFIFAAFVIFVLIAKQNFGDRFFQGLLIDGSALARVDVFRAFNYINSNDFWLGNSKNYIPVMNKLGAGGVENSYIVAIINYGIVLAVVLFILFFLWIKKLLNAYALFARFVIICSFVLVGSMNNSLISSSSWMFFILCVHSFMPIKIPQCVSNIQQCLFHRRNHFVL